MPRALLSVSDKTGIEELARNLVALGYEIISTGGTQKALRAAKIPVTAVEEVTRFPESFGGRVKTMHPMIMGGILFRRDHPDDVKEAKTLGIEPIDVVVVNLYPFTETASDKKKTEADIIEQIDIGGPTLLRSAAKNHQSVTVICDPADYGRVMSELKGGGTSRETRSALAAKVFVHTAEEDGHIAHYFGMNRGIILTNGQKLRYGENPHQWGEYYSLAENSGGGWGTLHQGKALSYLNILDADAAWSAVCEFSDPAAVLVKHANPSGIASAKTIEDAFQRAYDADRLSAFGVIIALNRPCTDAIAKKIVDQKIFTEVIVAPGYAPAALETLGQKPNIRVITQSNGAAMQQQILYRSVKGGMLVQNADTRLITKSDVTVVTAMKPTPRQMEDLLFAWKCVKHAKSNAIVFAKDAVTVGIGAGQTSRVDATWIAARRAGEKAKDAVMASDAFLPFPDSVEEAAKHGIAAVIQPGGSMRDQEVFAKAEELGLIMVTTGVRAFRH